MQIHNYRYGSLIVNVFTIFVTSIILTGCFAFSSGQSDEQPISSVSEGKAEPIINKNGVITEYAPPRSLSEKARLSSVIVIGQVEQENQTLNLSRDPNDINKPDLTRLELGQIYQIKVERVLKGDNVASTLSFVQYEGFLIKSQAGAAPSAEDISLARQNGDFFPFVKGRRYLLFLEPMRGFEKEQYWIGGIAPSRFDITDENNAFPEGMGAIDRRPVPLTDIIKQIEAALTSTPEATVISPSPTPAPIETSAPAGQTAP